MSTRSFHDQLSIDTPEHVSLRLPIAGLGSRFLAIFADTVIQIVAYALLILLLVLAASGFHSPSGPSSPKAEAWATAVLIFMHFLLYWGYFTLFEGLWSGQTPGKRIFKLRVIKDSGRQITLFESAARNLLRVVDALPGFYVVAIISVLVTGEKKRIGDMVAGTLVVHQEDAGETGDHDVTRTFTAGFYEPPVTAAATRKEPAFPANAIARLGANDLILLDTYFARIPELDVATKDKMAERMLAALCVKMQVPVPEGFGPRALLESIAYQLRSQTSLQIS